ncbi:MAG: DUF4065 domain-containing protein [Candidatus Kaistia colombiensis]|nr:MAG: DUF4065 domain-containing protein [Kaistia sp.]
MTVSASAAARHICAAGNWQVTNLQLQKLLYLAQMLHMGQTRGDRLMNSTFEAWDYGPVDPNVYRRVAMFGARPIQDVFFGVNAIDGTPEAAVIDEVCGSLISKPAGELVAITHWDQGAWAKNYRSGAKGIIIPDQDILAEYDARVAA